MIYPVDPHFPITQKFGENPDWYKSTHGHPGLDFGCPVGTPVKAVLAGVVVFAGLDPETAANPKAGYGLHIRVQGLQYLAIYGHLSVTMVGAGNQVEEGEPIGQTGNTGFSTGPHLHFELRTAAAIATTCVDPLPFLNQAQQPNRQPIFYAVVVADVLMIRKDPSRTHGPLGNLKKGDIIPVYSLAGSDVWVEHDRGFSAFALTGENLMQVACSQAKVE